MQELGFTIVNTFTNKPFAGNPCAVCRLDAWLPDELLAQLATEIRAPVTSFLKREGRAFALRWFSRTGTEVRNLCGHGTLAAAHVLLMVDKGSGSSVDLITRNRTIQAERDKTRVVVGFPRWAATRIDATPELDAAFGASPVEYWASDRDFMAVFANEAEVRSLQPDIAAMMLFGHRGFTATGPGTAHDCVSRFFCPTFGTGEDEDSVTGSAHCTIAPYWAARLGMSTIRAYQASARGGELRCVVNADGVRIGAENAVFAEGHLTLGSGLTDFFRIETSVSPQPADRPSENMSK
jgi:predicted PhzF superfamily epimerase YddE/YHI9